MESDRGGRAPSPDVFGEGHEWIRPVTPGVEAADLVVAIRQLSARSHVDRPVDGIAHRKRGLDAARRRLIGDDAREFPAVANAPRRINAELGEL